MNNFKDESDKRKLVQLIFIFSGAVLIFVGCNILSGGFHQYLGYLMFGTGVVSLGYYFGPDYFIKKWGPDNKLPKVARVITLIGYSIIILGGAYSYFGQIL